MKNLKVSMKLVVSFVMVIVLAIIVGAVGIYGMYSMNVGDDALYKGNYLPTVMAGDISQIIVEQRVHLRNFVIYDVDDDADIFVEAKASLDNSKTEMDKLLAEYYDTIVLDEDRQAYNELVSIYTREWLPALDIVYEYGHNNQQDDAKVAMTATAVTAAKMDELTTQLQTFNLNDGQSTVDKNSAMFIRMAVIEGVVLLISVVIAVALIIYVSGLISKPLSVLTDFMKVAGSSGNITLRPEDIKSIEEYSKYKDETGQCIASTASFVNHVSSIAGSLGAVAAGDLTVDVQVLSDDDVLGVSVQKMMDNLNNMFGEINNSSAQVATGTKQISDGSQTLAQGSTEQAAAVEQLSSSITEIAQKTKENSALAGKAADLANTIKGNAEKGSRQMDEMMAAVKDINEASQSINKVIKVIDDIAFQTNILALNAAVEAARAGQHGKGFAVVAEEVRNLAAKSAEAAKDTGGLIENSMAKAELGARIADETAASLTEIVSGINESASLVSDIAKSSEEQTAGIAQINRGIDQVASVIQENSATAEQSAAASQQMSAQASLLEELVARFKLKDNLQSLSMAYAETSSLKQLSAPKTDKTASAVAGKY